MENLLGYAKAARRVFAVDDDEIGGEPLAQGRKLLAERTAPVPSDHVPENNKRILFSAGDDAQRR